MCVALDSAVVLPRNLNPPGSVLATMAVLFFSIEAESIMQWRFLSDDRGSFIRMQFVLSALITTFDEPNVGFPITQGTSSALMGNLSRYSLGGSITMVWLILLLLLLLLLLSKLMILIRVIIVIEVIEADAINTYYCIIEAYAIDSVRIRCLC
jgi:hypothetical protein